MGMVLRVHASEPLSGKKLTMLGCVSQGPPAFLAQALPDW